MTLGMFWLSLINWLQTMCVIVNDVIVTQTTLISFFLLDKIMWTVSKGQIYMNKINNLVIQVKEILQYKKNNITIEFVKNDVVLSYYHVFFENDKLTKICGYACELLCNRNIAMIHDPNGLKWDDIINLKLFPSESNFDFFVLSNYKNNHLKMSKKIKDIPYIINISNRIDKNECYLNWKESVDNSYIPIFLEITYPNIKPISFQLKTEKYNFLILGNVLDKPFFNYFIKKYYSLELYHNNDNYNNYNNETYLLTVIDHNVKRHQFTEKDTFTIGLSRDKDNKQIYTIFE